MSNAGTVTVKLNSNMFQKGLKYAKQAGGKFNAAEKTWNIPADCSMLGAAAAYGWVIVGQVVAKPEVKQAGGNGYGTSEWFARSAAAGELLED